MTFKRSLAQAGLLLAAASPAVAQAAPAPPSALLRWWHALGRPSLRITSDDRGMRLMESGGGGPERIYQVWRDGSGAAHESYWENGVARPVDPAVQQWAQARIRESQSVPPPPAPPTPPAPPAPPLPPPPPPPPEPKTFVPGEAGEAAFRRAQGDARLRALLGDPVTLSPEAKGSLQVWGPAEPKGWMHHTLHAGAAADLTLRLSGPRGTALLRMKGERRNERRGEPWTFSLLELQPSDGRESLNLLKP
ncbi:MAG TPA: cytochrome c oxidase assembly factor Coa1 family protein [Geothrix sp.]|nr:cytochrome c oxidase assembly factor Coa1 family protein [Geothrix sp.]